ncbi:hypothetical protein RHO15_09580 [Utexia brackfieldae]|uniref:hypothetical protein n=1 Tax=Utexia brackfieldae TaxID=3074108 RepID=UPI00370DD59A
MNDYPLNLETVLLSSYSRQQQASFTATDARSGAVYVKKTAIDPPAIRSVTFRFPRHKAAIFLGWFNSQLKKGLEPFDIPLMTEWGMQTLRCRFLPDSLLDTTRPNTLHWQYTAQLLIPSYKAPDYWPDGSYQFPEYMDDDAIRFLDIIINEQLAEV